MFHNMDRRALRLRACLEALEDRRLLAGYAATELGLSVSPVPLEGGLSNNGSVVAFQNETQTTVVRRKSGALTPVNAGPQTRANDLSESGIVVGTFGGVGASRRAFVWENGVATELPGLGGGESVANAVNNDGVVVGYARDPADRFPKGMIWRDGVAEVMPTLGGQVSIANDINNEGAIVGESTTSSNSSRAFIYQDGEMTDLGTLTSGPFALSNALGVNDSNQVVGGSFDFPNGMEAFIWSDGQMTGLGTLGGTYSLAHDINNDGVVVGQSRTAAGPLAGFIWTAEGGMVDLNSLVEGLGHIDHAININERGQILAMVGNGLVLLTPTDDAAAVSPPEAADDSLGEAEEEESEEVSLLA